MRKKVYIAGPITKGDRNDNLYVALKAHDTLIKKGYAPLNPMLTMLMPNAFSESHGHQRDTWIQVCLPWVYACDCLLRLPGESAGADLEVEYAHEHGKPVFTSLERLLGDA